MTEHTSGIDICSEALMIAYEFIDRVTEWEGHEDDRQEALQACDDALADICPCCIAGKEDR
jgi:hypothetical protein